MSDFDQKEELLHNTTFTSEPSTQEQYDDEDKITEKIIIVQSLLKDLIEHQGQECQSIFSSQESPKISIGGFIKRIQKFTHFSQQCLIIAICYLDRYNQKNESFCLNNSNVYKVFLTCILLASKFHDDFYYDNNAFVIAGGVTSTQLLNFQVEIYLKICNEALISQEQYKQMDLKLKQVYKHF